MELYGVSQLDKTAAAYPEHMQYEAPPSSLGRSPVNKFGPVSPANILASSAWSAIIHRPAEDSEPDELPSTVDIDAIKEPPTPMAPRMLTPLPEPTVRSSAAESSSGSDSEADSSSDSGGESNTDSEEGSGSGSCSWSSGSECGSESKRSAAAAAAPPPHSSCSSQSSDSDQSTQHNKQFSVRETNFDQGGLKLKISALKIPKKPVPPVREESSSSSSSSERDHSSSDEEADKSSDASRASPVPVRKHNPDSVRKYTQLPRTPEPEPPKPQKEEPVVVIAKPRESPLKDVEEKKPTKTHTPVHIEKKETFVKPARTVSEEKLIKSAANSAKLVKEDPRGSIRGSARLASLNAKSEAKNVKTPTKVNNRTSNVKITPKSVKPVTPIKSAEKVSPVVQSTAGTSRLRNYRKKPRSRAETEKTPSKVTSAARRRGADSCDSDDEDEEETDERRGGEQSVTQMAQPLAEPETSIPISDQLQVINQEDLAAILPDVVGVFDGFEDVSGSEGRGAKGAAPVPPVGQESSSDMELLPEQEQIVSEAIKRIDLDSDSPEHDEEQKLSSASGEEDDHEEVGYSSSLLQQFVEKTEQLSKVKLPKSNPPVLQKEGGAGAGQRRRRGRPPKNCPVAPPNNTAANDHQNRLVMPELEAYMRLDCSTSNVSPDSGIQSVTGSPSHQSPAWQPPAHSPARPPADPPDKPKPQVEKITKLYATTAELLGEMGGKRGPGRPKGSGRRKRRRLINPELLLLNKEQLRHARDVLKVPPFYRNPHQKTVVNMVERNDEIPRLPGMVPGKRGPGRPKKMPPTLEPMIPLNYNKGKKPSSNHGGGKGKERGEDRFDPHLKSSGSLLNDICERVSKRLDIPLPKVQKTLYDRDGPSGYVDSSGSRLKPRASLEKRKKARRKLLESRSLAVSKGLMKMKHHKHKKRKKLKKPVSSLDPKLLTEIEKLILDFNKMCRINLEASQRKTLENPPLPSIFRVKRIVKKRKGSERDKDSGPELESKDRTPTHNSSANSAPTPSVIKRRPKKSAVETTKNRDKDRPETNNEQRLPLKKRHYHISTPPTLPSAESAASPKPELSQESSKSSAKSVVVNSSEKSSEKTPAAGAKSGSGGSKVAATPASGKTAEKTTKVESKVKVDHRNSIDEAIEATITRYAHESRSVIVTPKKRHRLEMDKKSGTSPVVRNSSGSKTEPGSVASPLPTKRVGSRSSSTNNVPPRAVSPSPTSSHTRRATARSVSKQESAAPRQRSGSRGSAVAAAEVATPVTATPAQVPPVTKRANTRSSDTPVQPVVALGKRTSRVAASADKPVITSATQAVLNKRATREKAAATIDVKPATPEPVKPITQDVGVLSTRSAAKITPGAPLISPIPLLESNPSSKSLRLRSNKPPAGVFEPSTKADELMNLVGISPTVVNKMDSVLNQLSEKLKSFETTDTPPTPLLKLDESHNGRNRPKRLLHDSSSGDEEKKLKKRKIIRDIRVHVTKLSPSDLVLKKVIGVVKSKIRRRNRINRTGFPVKKKKKKKPLETISIENIQSDPALDKELDMPKLLPDFKDLEKTKILDYAVLHDLPAPILCVEKIDCIKIREDEKKLNEEIKEEVSEPKSLSQESENSEDSVSLSNIVKKSEDTKPLTTRLSKKPDVLKADTKTKIKTETTVNEEKSDKTKVEIRKSSRRLMVLKARQRVEASKRRKRKQGVTSVQGIIPREKRSPSPDLPPSSPMEIHPPEARLLSSKRLRRPREDADKDDSDADSAIRKKQPPRWRKKYLTAGLFSDCHKEDEPRKSGGAGEVSKSRLLYNPSQHKHGLLPPPCYCDKWVRQRRINFQLPHDLWWLHTNNQLPGRDLVPSWNYKKIRTNVYYDIKPVQLYEAQACNCKAGGERDNKCCGEECINRMIYSECSPQQCPCEDKCSNQRIQRHEWAPGLEKFMTKDKGWGVKTKYAIKNGEFILEYVGEVVSEKEFKNRMASRYQHDTHHYCLNLDGGLVIDGHRMGGDGRFVNHSCEPNCEMQKWSVNGLFRMALFALRDIDPHEELTYDYNFSLFNPAEGQKCKCGSKNCRGVIGGKSQRVDSSGAVIEPDKPRRKPRKTRKQAKGRPRAESQSKPTLTSTPAPSVPSSAPPKETKELSHEAIVARLNHLLLFKPLLPPQRAYVAEHRVFLLRNLDKVVLLRDKLKQAVQGSAVAVEEAAAAPGQQAAAKQAEVFLSQLTALSTPRNVRTRRLAQAQDNPEMTKTARLAQVFRSLYNAVAQAKEEDGELLAAPLVSLPPKRKLPQYYQRVPEPIDLTQIEQNIVTGVYKTVESFDQDVCKLFSNNVRFYGRTSDVGIAATRLRKIYSVAKLEYVEQLSEILGESVPASFLPEQEDPGAEEEDVIRCICGMFRDEGLMIQCERCLVWQHCDCVRADTDADKYLCERCCPRDVDYEIPLEATPEYATEGQSHYMTLLRGDLQLRQGDTVYVLRDLPNEDSGSQTNPPSKHTYKTIKNFKYIDCDIFRIERLWKDEKGDRFAFGHHYLRPHETFHEPTRKFFNNELMRIPLYEVVPLDLIMGHCYVLDINTFCKGKPVGADSEHIYICEYRVDKSARLFAKLAKSKTPPVCLKSFAFEKYDQRLKISRTYTPHGPVKGGGVGVSRGRGGRSAEDATTAQHNTVAEEEEELPLARVRDSALAKRAQQKAALNSILLRLLARLPSKQPLDVSYLLEPGRRHRKRPALLSP